MKRYIFGFDAGTCSGAWSIIDTIECKIVASGLFPNNTEDKRKFADKVSPYCLDMDVVLEDVIPMKNTNTANMALKGSVMFMEGVFYTLYEDINIYYVDPAINSNHPLGCWLKEFELTSIKIDTAGLCRKDINKKMKEKINEETIDIVRFLYSNADEFLSKPTKIKPPPKKPSNKTTEPKPKKPDPNIATSILIAEFHKRKRTRSIVRR